MVEAVGRAPLDEDGWTRALQMISAGLGAAATQMEISDLRTGEVRLDCPMLIDETTQKLYEERIYQVNPRSEFAMRSRLGLCVDDSDMLYTPNAAEYFDWLRPLDLRYFQGAKILHSDGAVGFIASHFTEKHGLPDSEMKRAHKALIPHVVNAVAVGKILSQSALRTQAFNEILLERGGAIAFIDLRGNIVETSPKFDAVVRNAGLLATQGRKLVAARHADRAKVAALIASAIRTKSDLAPPFSVLLPRDGRQGIVLRAIPIRSRDSLLGVLSPAAMIAISDLDEPNSAKCDEVARLFGLTKREADVAGLLIEGYSVEQIASKLELSVYTTRQHLQGVFRKTGAQRQADVIRIVSNLP